MSDGAVLVRVICTAEGHSRRDRPPTIVKILEGTDSDLIIRQGRRVWVGHWPLVMRGRRVDRVDTKTGRPRPMPEEAISFTTEDLAHPDPTANTGEPIPALQVICPSHGPLESIDGSELARRLLDARANKRTTRIFRSVVLDG